MSLECSSCFNPIAAGDATCPHCGTAQPPGPAPDRAVENGAPLQPSKQLASAPDAGLADRADAAPRRPLPERPTPGIAAAPAPASVTAASPETATGSPAPVRAAKVRTPIEPTVSARPTTAARPAAAGVAASAAPRPEDARSEPAVPTRTEAAVPRVANAPSAVRSAPVPVPSVAAAVAVRPAPQPIAPVAAVAQPAPQPTGTPAHPAASTGNKATIKAILIVAAVVVGWLILNGIAAALGFGTD